MISTMEGIIAKNGQILKLPRNGLMKILVDGLLQGTIKESNIIQNFLN